MEQYLIVLTFPANDQNDMETRPDQQKYKYNDKRQRQKDKKRLKKRQK